MLSEKQKREAQLSILEKLRKKGAPGKEPSDNEMNGMFDLGVGEDGKIAYNEGEPQPETDESEDVVPYAPGKRRGSQPALTPLPVGGGLLKPKKPSKKSML